MVRDRVESEYRDLFKRYRMGTTIWSPLESGILARRYLNGIPDDSRYNKSMIMLHMIFNLI